MDFAALRDRMVETHIKTRGIRDPLVLAAMKRVPREKLLPPELAEFAYQDSPLPIAAGQTISQPYVVALMTAALGVRPGDRVLEIGTGSGYAAAVVAEIAGRVFTIERHDELAKVARRRLGELGYRNIEVRCGDGTLGWPEEAPFQGIVVTAGGPELPRPLLDQLAIGGRLVMPVGPTRVQTLVRVTRRSEADFAREDLGQVQFVPLIGRAGWADAGAVLPARAAARSQPVARLVAECAEPIDRMDDVDLAPLLERIGDARVVLLGEATHGTSEFYRMRARITRELILRRGFTAVAVEADWPDAATLDRYVRGDRRSPPPWRPFARFPTWMWRNQETAELVEWLRAHNLERREPERQVSFHGLDLYSMYTSAYEVVRYLERVDAQAAAVARERYGCLTPWQADPAVYGRAVLSGRFRACEREVVTMLTDLLARRLDYIARDGDDFLDASRNAAVVADAERYYRAMYKGPVASWNLRDQHMVDTLRAVRAHRGEGTRVVVWAHNSHIGDAAATEMGARGEHNIGHLCRRELGDDAYLIGFGTDHGRVAAAHEWDGPVEIMSVRPAREGSYERLCHESGVPAFFLSLRQPVRDALREELLTPLLERAIGVIYRPDSELASHYFQAVLPVQFDEYVWFDDTTAVTPLESAAAGAPAHRPFGEE